MKQKCCSVWLTLFSGLLIGILTGCLVSLYNYGLLKIAEIRQTSPFLFIPWLCLAGVAILFLFSRFGSELQGSVNYVLKMERTKKSAIPLRLIPLVMLTTWLTQLFGGSTGRIGGAVEIGAAVSSNIEQKLITKKQNIKDSSILISCGMAAGFAAIFQTPFAAVFFVTRLNDKHTWSWSTFLALLSASLSAKFVAAFFGIQKMAVALPRIPWNHLQFWLFLVVFAIIFGLVGRFFSISIKILTSRFQQWFPEPYLRVIIISILLSILFLLLHQGRYAGLGLELIQDSFHGGTIYTYDWFVKFVLSVVTLSVGYQGGVATPLFVIGSTLGVFLGSVVGLPILICAALGYIAVFSSATNTLIAPVIIGIEAFGWAALPLYLLVCSIANNCNGNHSVFD